MTEQEIKEYIDLTVKRSISEMKKNGLLKDAGNVLYEDASEILTNYYNSGKAEASITYAIQSLRFDPYYRIIPLYFERGYKLESIAEELGVDVSTIVRNKKRLCLDIYARV